MNQKVTFLSFGKQVIMPLNCILKKFLWDKINYIHNNPVVEKFVAKPECWLYSSASNYIEGESILPEVMVLPQKMKTIV
ncbi:hypothetical protein [Croceivirga radicis]|uniref:hypothetical protein n=1 Tax=Croceivirga radicis TaxID=1929488 RepID=UPI001ED942A7|nr:hypothetical protein [Croceivirga radicis]